MGITSPMLPREQSSLGRSVAFADTVADPEDTGGEEGRGDRQLGARANLDGRPAFCSAARCYERPKNR